MQSQISLHIDGLQFTAWQSARIIRAFDAVAGAFSLTIGSVDSVGNQVLNSLKPSQVCVLYLEGEPVIIGYIDDISHSYSASSHTLSISGRDRTADLVDCCAIHAPDEWHDVQIDYIANVLCEPFGINVKVKTQTQIVAKFRLEQGETAFNALDRLCRSQGLIVNSDTLGNLIITRKSTAMASVKLEYGVNILSANYIHSAKELYSNYFLKGQQPYSTDSENGAVKVTIKDSSIARFRPFLMLAEDITSTASATLRLEKEIENRKAKSRQISVTVQGWREYEGGSLWLPNKIIPLKDKMLGIDESFFIAKVEYSYSEQGSMTTLTLESLTLEAV